MPPDLRAGVVRFDRVNADAINQVPVRQDLARRFGRAAACHGTGAAHRFI